MNRYNILIKLFQTLLLSVLFFWFYNNMNFYNIFNYFTNDFIIAICLSQITIIFSTALVAYRHLYFVNSDKLSFKVALSAIIIGTGYNYILPARISELLKATYIREKSNIPLGIGVGAVFLERLSDLIIVAVLGLISIIFFALDFDLYLALSIFVISLMSILIIIIFRDKIVWLSEKLIKWDGLQKFITKTFVHIHEQVSSKRFIVGLFFGTVIWSFSILTIGIFMNIAGDMKFGVIATITLLIGGAVGLAIPALPGGLGTFEAVAVVVMMKYGYDFDTSMALALGLRLSNMILILPLALMVSVKNGTGLSKILRDLRGDK